MQNEDKFVSLSDAARQLGTTRDYLNVLIHRGKLRAKKIGRNWVTTADWIAEYLGGRQRNEIVFELEKIKLEHELEIAKLNQEIRLREIAREEKLELAHLAEEGMPEAREPWQEGQATTAPEQDEIAALELEKQELAMLFTQQLENMKSQLEEEKNTKQAMLFAFEHLKEQLHDSLQMRMNELAEYLNEKLLQITAERTAISDQGLLIADMQKEIASLKDGFVPKKAETRELELPVTGPQFRQDFEPATDWQRCDISSGGKYCIAIDTKKHKASLRITPEGLAQVYKVRNSNYPIKRYSLPSLRLIAATGGALALLAFGMLGTEKIENAVARFGTEPLVFAEIGQEWARGSISAVSTLAQNLNTESLTSLAQGLDDFTFSRVSRAANLLAHSEEREGPQVLGANTAAYESHSLFGDFKHKIRAGARQFFTDEPYFRARCRQ